MSRLEPRPLEQWPAQLSGRLEGVFCDIDDTLTHDGRLVPEAFAALSALRSQGLKVVPVTGRPGGWVDQIARLWPVDGVVGENGGLWMWLDEQTGRLERRFAQSEDDRAANRERLTRLGEQILARVPGAALASDQPYRDLDLAIDFCEDVPRLDDDAIEHIVAAFQQAGATCKVSSIHVNGWFGTFDKLSGCRAFVRERWGVEVEALSESWAYVGDSANDEPMFAAFPLSIGVANVRDFLPRMTDWPTWITRAEGGHGFAEAVDIWLAGRASIR